MIRLPHWSELRQSIQLKLKINPQGPLSVLVQRLRTCRAFAVSKGLHVHASKQGIARHGRSYCSCQAVGYSPCNPARARWPGLVSFAAMAALLFCSSAAKAQIVDSGPSVKSLKTAQHRGTDGHRSHVRFQAPEKLLEAASAIQVITQDEIRRSGASNIPEALRLAGNLNVAEQNSHD